MLFSTLMRYTPLVWLLTIATPAFPWGAAGHNLIMRIADAQLTPAARAHIVEILGPGKTLESVATWADEVRRTRPETGTWHYIDIPIDKPHLDMARDCPKGDCVLGKVEDFRKALSAPATPPEERREALMFLVHFVADLHQPLHSSDNNDHGGNGVQVQYFDKPADKPSNLHSAWDTALVEHLGPADQIFPQLSRESASHAKKFSAGTLSQWAEETHGAAQKVVYGKLPKAEPGTPVVLDAAYEKASDRLIRRQLELAGARLAAMLNHDLQ